MLDQFTTQSVAMSLFGPWFRPVLVNMANQFHWDVAQPPKSPTTGHRGSVVYTDEWGIYASSKVARETWDFMKFLISKDGQTKWTELIGARSISPIKEVAQTDKWLSYGGSNGKLILDTLAYSKAPPVNFGNANEAETMWNDELGPGHRRPGADDVGRQEHLRQSGAGPGPEQVVRCASGTGSARAFRMRGPGWRGSALRMTRHRRLVRPCDSAGSPGPGEVLLRPIVSGVCGTDLHVLHGEGLGEATGPADHGPRSVRRSRGDRAGRRADGGPTRGGAEPLRVWRAASSLSAWSDRVAVRHVLLLPARAAQRLSAHVASGHLARRQLRRLCRGARLARHACARPSTT